MRFRALVGTVLGLLVLSGCSGGSSSHSGGEELARSPQEAVQKLSTRHVRAFDQWKSQLVKSCDAAQAFGVRTRHDGEHDGIDGVALLQGNEGSPIFSDEASIAVLSGHQGLMGESDSRVSESVEVNGRTTKMQAVAKRQGSTCMIYAFGQKIYETKIFGHFVVGAYWNPQRAESEVEQPLEVWNLSSGGRSEVRMEMFTAAVRQVFAPNLDFVNMFQNKLNLQREEILKYFKAARELELSGALRLAQDPLPIWTNLRGRTLVASSAGINRLTVENPGAVSFELQLKIPEFSLAPGDATSVRGRLQFLVKSDFLKGSAPMVKAVHLQAPAYVGHLQPDSVEALRCSKEQVEAFVTDHRGREVVRPSTADLWNLCGVFHSDVVELADQSDLVRELLPLALAGIRLSPSTRLLGWDHLLQREALELYQQGLDVQEGLDPHGRADLIGRLARNLKIIQRELQTAQNKEQLRGPFFDVAVTWNSRYVVYPEALMARSVRVLDRIVVDLPAASRNLMSTLARGEDGVVNERLRHAESLDSSFFIQVREARAEARALQYEEELDRSYLAMVLEKQTSSADVLAWTLRLRKIRSNLLRFPAFQKVQPELVAYVMRQGEVPGRADRVMEEVLPSLARLVDPFVESTKKWLQMPQHSTNEEVQIRDFASAVNVAYKNHALSLLDSAKRLGRERQGREIFDSVLQSKWPRELMAKNAGSWVATRAFFDREQERTRHEFGSPNEYALRRFVDRGLQEVWEMPQFQALENLALVAKSKNTCERRQGMSSLAECANERLFSTQTKMFFDAAWGPRYNQVALEFQGHMRALTGHEWTNMRWSLVGALFGPFDPLWSQCDNTVFQQNAAGLKADVQSLVRERDTFKKWEIERRIRTRLENCRRG